MSKCKTVCFLSFKGGPGKSTIADMLQNRLESIGKSVILSLDIGQDAQGVNTGETINLSDAVMDIGYSDEEVSDGSAALEITKAIQEDYDYLIIDTPGEQTEDVKKIIDEGFDDIDYLIFPVMAGKRTRNATLDSFKILSVLEKIKSHQKILFVINRVYDEAMFETEKIKAEEYLSDFVEDFSNISYTYLYNTKALVAMEDNNASIDDLSAQNRVAYSVFKKRVNKTIDSILDFMEVQHG